MNVTGRTLSFSRSKSFSIRTCKSSQLCSASANRNLTKVTYIDGTPILCFENLLHQERQIGSKHTAAMATKPHRVLLRCEVIIHAVVQALGELYIFGERMNAPVAIPLAHRAIAFNSHALFLALRLLGVQWRRELHLVLNGATVAVEVVCGVYAIRLGPRHF